MVFCSLHTRWRTSVQRARHSHTRERNYCPSRSDTTCRSYVVGAQQAYYKFYRS